MLKKITLELLVFIVLHVSFCYLTTDAQTTTTTAATTTTASATTTATTTAAATTTKTNSSIKICYSTFILTLIFSGSFLTKLFFL